MNLHLQNWTELDFLAQNEEKTLEIFKLRLMFQQKSKP